LTACIAQRPRFVWSYVFRGKARVQLGDRAGAVQDVKRALGVLPERERATFLRARIVLDPGLQPLCDVPEFKELGRLF
jgi:hypothetical protein